MGQDLVDAPGTAPPQLDRVVKVCIRGCPDSWTQFNLCNSGECGENCSDKFQQFLVGCERPCDPAATVFLVCGALFDSGYIFCVSLGDFWKNFWLFYVNGYSRLLRSILVLLFPLSEVAALVVDTGSGLFLTGFAGENATRAVFRTFAFTQNGEVYTVFASADYFSLEIWTLFLRPPCILQYFQLCAGSARWFFGALDDEEFFVVEGSTTKNSSNPR